VALVMRIKGAPGTPCGRMGEGELARKRDSVTFVLVPAVAVAVCEVEHHRLPVWAWSERGMRADELRFAFEDCL